MGRDFRATLSVPVLGILASAAGGGKRPQIELPWLSGSPFLNSYPGGPEAAREGLGRGAAEPGAGALQFSLPTPRSRGTDRVAKAAE